MVNGDAWVFPHPISVPETQQSRFSGCSSRRAVAGDLQSSHGKAPL